MSNQLANGIDNFDRHILDILQESNRTTSDQIAEQVGLSAAAVQRRIKRMREQQIIRADISVVNPKAVGQNISLIVQVTLERERMDLLDSFKKAMSDHKSVQQCYYVTGSADFILLVSAADMEEYEEFTREVFFGNDNVKGFETNVVMDSVKSGLSVPVLLNT